MCSRYSSTGFAVDGCSRIAGASWRPTALSGRRQDFLQPFIELRASPRQTLPVMYTTGGPPKPKSGLSRRILLPQQSMKSSSETVVRSSGSDRVLVIMAKAPRAGAVKTRLTSSLSPAAVTALYSCLLHDTLALARSLKVADVEVAIMCPDTDVNDLAQLAGGEVSVVAQRGEGLAAGLTSVFAHFTPDHQKERHQRRTIAFNSDSPHLPRSVLEDAFETLAAHDVVVGPTHDGGYYLVGAKASHPALFAGDGMGTSSALERFLSRARTLELSVGFADPFYDIDVADDLTRLAAELRLAPARAPRTARWLKEWESVTPQLRTGTGELY